MSIAQELKPNKCAHTGAQYFSSAQNLSIQPIFSETLGFGFTLTHAQTNAKSSPSVDWPQTS
ncbi:MAG: hypothetical protein K2Q97_14465, partial [Burkholderiaceae bacterium]|nr:hypothetical protein [Burkholderiaceae bacterium]